MLIGGAIGNLIDRVDSGAVTDFIKLPHWPAFNVADMSITFGVIVLVLVLDRGRGRRWLSRRSRSSSQPDAAGRRLDQYPRRAARLAGACGPDDRRTVSCASTGAACPSATSSLPGQRRRGARAERPRREPPSLRTFRIAIVFEDTHLLVVDKPAGVVVHPGSRSQRGHAGAGARGARRGRRGARTRRDRPPAGPRHVGSAGRRQERRGAPRAEGDDRRARASP